MPPLRVRYQTIEFGDLDIHVRTLRDKAQFQDDQGLAERLGISPATWPLFGVVWAAGQVLARLMLVHDVAGKRVLELGCGIGLSSLILNLRLSDITATDQHPEAEGFLAINVALNGGRVIPFVRAGWSDGDTSLGTFDLIIGSDLLYERDQVDALSGFIDRHARASCEVILVDPGRGLGARFSKQMVRLGYGHSQRAAGPGDVGPDPFRGQILRYVRALPASA